MPHFFIRRPNFAFVIAIVISLLGVLAIRSLPVSQYPDVAPPQIEINATYPGASAQVMNDNVTALIEEELNGARHLLYYDSTSDASGSATITATFLPGTDPNMAQVDVQNRLKRVEARLPAAVLQQGLSVEQADSDFLLMYTLNYREGAGNVAQHGAGDEVALADYAARRINNEIGRIPGVGKVQMFSSARAMRIWIDPDKLMGYRLSVDDVYKAIGDQNTQVAAGAIGALPASIAVGASDAGGHGGVQFTAPILVKGQLRTPADFGDIVLRATPNGAVVRLADVARIEVGRESYDTDTRLDGRAAVGVGVRLATGANALETAKAVRARLQALSAAFPPGIVQQVPYDTSRFVAIAIEKVVHTLIEAVVLVFLVMFLFLQNLRYTAIPTIVVPVCLLGTFAVMAGFGFSINMMTMFGMVLAIGILVDDAIIVVENVERIMAEEGLSPKDATRKAMAQIAGAIVGITLVLAAVFLPLALMGGSVGVIYRQFSMVLVVSILLSGFLALTLTPALCATLLKPLPAGHSPRAAQAGSSSRRQGRAGGRLSDCFSARIRARLAIGLFGRFNRGFDRVGAGYARVATHAVHRVGRYMLIYLLIVGGLAFSFWRLPSAFLPDEDQGYMLVDVQLPAAATLPRTVAALEKVEVYLASRPSMESVISVLGWSFSGAGQNAAMIFPTLKDWQQRRAHGGDTVASETARLNRHFGHDDSAKILAVVPPPISGLGTSGGFSFRLQDRGEVGYPALHAARDALMRQARASPVIGYVSVEGLGDVPQLRLDIDRRRAEAFGIGFATIRDALGTAFGSAQINEFANLGRMQKVIVQADAPARMTPDALNALYVPSRSGTLVPLAAFATPHWETGPAQLTRYNGYPAFKIVGDAAPGYTSGQAMAAMEAIASTLPPGIDYAWSDLSLQEKTAGAQAPLLMGLALLVVFLVLVALYESWSIPVAVMLIVPVGALGAVLAVTVTGLSDDVYFKVGLVTIIGLAAKNAILIVEFAKTLHEQGRSLPDAAVEAARLRFRPILMTSLAFILGVLPLAIARGAGAASQQSIGIGVVGGMLGVTLLGSVTIPVCFVAVMRLTERLKRTKQGEMGADASVEPIRQATIEAAVASSSKPDSAGQ